MSGVSCSGNAATRRTRRAPRGGPQRVRHSLGGQRPRGPPPACRGLSAWTAQPAGPWDAQAGCNAATAVSPRHQLKQSWVLGLPFFAITDSGSLQWELGWQWHHGIGASRRAGLPRRWSGLLLRDARDLPRSAQTYNHRPTWARPRLGAAPRALPEESSVRPCRSSGKGLWGASATWGTRIQGDAHDAEKNIWSAAPPLGSPAGYTKLKAPLSVYPPRPPHGPRQLRDNTSHIVIPAAAAPPSRASNAITLPHDSARRASLCLVARSGPRPSAAPQAPGQQHTLRLLQDSL